MKGLFRTRRVVKSLGAQRMNVGLTILAVIFLIVMAAAAAVRAEYRRSSQPVGETLAVLGVTPGAGTQPHNQTSGVLP